MLRKVVLCTTAMLISTSAGMASGREQGPQTSIPRALWSTIPQPMPIEASKRSQTQICQGNCCGECNSWDYGLPYPTRGCWSGSRCYACGQR